MKRFLLSLLAVVLFPLASLAQGKAHSIEIDARSLSAVQTDPISGVMIDKINPDRSQRPCARIKIHINRMSRDEIAELSVKAVGGNVEVMKQIVARQGNGLIIELTAKDPTRFYLHHPKYGDSNEVSLSLEGNKEYRINADINITLDKVGTIRYTSTNGKPVNPKEARFDANIVSNTYINGQGVIKFDQPITKIGGYAFEDCSSLTSITIPDSVKEIGYYAFYGCSSLISITIPNSVKEIGSRAFKGCSSLTSITIPDGVTYIGDSAFEGCSSLPVMDGLRYADTYLVEAADKSSTTYNIRQGTRFIGFYAFEGCSSLISITIPDSVTYIGNAAFKDCSSLPVMDGLRYADTYLVEAVDKSRTTYNIRQGTRFIGFYAFKGCSSLTSITIPNGVREIGWCAFEDCSSLTNITIPDSVTKIGHWAFEGCSSLTSITIPNSVTYIGESAFKGCSSLSTIYCKPSTPPTIYDWCFDGNASGRKIYVPRGSVEAYSRAKGWMLYRYAIVGYDF